MVRGRDQKFWRSTPCASCRGKTTWTWRPKTMMIACVRRIYIFFYRPLVFIFANPVQGWSKLLSSSVVSFSHFRLFLGNHSRGLHPMSSFKFIDFRLIFPEVNVGMKNTSPHTREDVTCYALYGPWFGNKFYSILFYSTCQTWYISYCLTSQGSMVKVIYTRQLEQPINGQHLT